MAFSYVLPEHFAPSVPFCPDLLLFVCPQDGYYSIHPRGGVCICLLPWVEFRAWTISKQHGSVLDKDSFKS